MNIEVETRSFISKEQYNNLKEYFSEHAQLEVDDKQETHYFDCEQDLRIQKNTQFAKVWLKKGQLHDDSREEIEIKTSVAEFDELAKLFDALGYTVQIKWFRHRLQYKWNDITVCLDHTKGYGYILELEKMSSEADKKSTYDYLLSKLAKLHVNLTPKEEFQKKYTEYKTNWRELTQ